MGLFSSNPKFYSTLSPEQSQLMGALGPRLSAMASQGPGATTYGGQLTTPITPEEQTNVNNASRFGAVAGNTLSDLSNYNDANFNEQFQNEIADPTYKNFTQNVQPLLEESLPTFSTARGNVVARELGNTSNALMEQRFAAREAAKNRALQAATQGAQFYQTQAGTLAIPREIVQAGLDKQFANFYAGNAAYQAGLDSMLNFLGIQTKVGIQQPSIFDKINTVLSTINSIKNIANPFASGGTGYTPSNTASYSGASGSSIGSIGNASGAGADAGFSKAMAGL